MGGVENVGGLDGSQPLPESLRMYEMEPVILCFGVLLMSRKYEAQEKGVEQKNKRFGVHTFLPFPLYSRDNHS